MIKKIIIWTAVIVIVGFGVHKGLYMYTKSFSPSKEAHFHDEKADIVVKYCSPSQKGRMLFGPENKGVLVPYDKVWRTGANEATRISFNTEVRFGETLVPKGDYSLFTIPQQDEWTVILNKQTELWGAFNYDVTEDVARAKVPVHTSTKNYEQLTIDFLEKESTTELLIMWGKTQVIVPIEVM